MLQWLRGSGPGSSVGGSRVTLWLFLKRLGVAVKIHMASIVAVSLSNTRNLIGGGLGVWHDGGGGGAGRWG